MCRCTDAAKLLSSALCILLSAFTLPSAYCNAAELPDPTRPPAGISAAQEQAATPKASGLQSVLISPARRAAIINGQTVVLGGKLGDSRLVEVSEAGVVLQGPSGRRELALFPDVGLNKKDVAPVQKPTTPKRAARRGPGSAASEERK
jgi:MSHA biogenesis protein MshK